jgi:predicted XRE-type DNA-binding protein
MSVTLNILSNIFQIMLLPAEIESKTLIPALRAILAKKLAEQHNIREDEISKMLGVTQAAISNYITLLQVYQSLLDCAITSKPAFSYVIFITV